MEKTSANVFPSKNGVDWSLFKSCLFAPLSAIPLSVTWGTFSGVTGRLGMLFIKAVDPEIVISIAALQVSATFLLNHSTSLPLTVKHSSL